MQNISEVVLHAFKIGAYIAAIFEKRNTVLVPNSMHRIQLNIIQLLTYVEVDMECY